MWEKLKAKLSQWDTRRHQVSEIVKILTGQFGTFSRETLSHQYLSKDSLQSQGISLSRIIFSFKNIFKVNTQMDNKGLCLMKYMLKQKDINVNKNSDVHRGTKYYLYKSSDNLYNMQIYIFEQILLHSLVNIFNIREYSLAA